jgi:hypothetical protein
LYDVDVDPSAAAILHHVDGSSSTDRSGLYNFFFPDTVSRNHGNYSSVSFFFIESSASSCATAPWSHAFFLYRVIIIFIFFFFSSSGDNSNDDGTTRQPANGIA